MKKLLLILSLCLQVQAQENITPQDFKLKEYKTNKEVSLKELKKKKVLINFWASWCTSCIQEIPLLHGLKNDPKAKDYYFIAINAGDNNKKIKKFLKKTKFNYQVLKDSDRSMSKSWGVTSLPVTVVIDQKGDVLFKGTRPPKALP